MKSATAPALQRAVNSITGELLPVLGELLSFAAVVVVVVREGFDVVFAAVPEPLFAAAVLMLPDEFMEEFAAAFVVELVLLWEVVAAVVELFFLPVVVTVVVVLFVVEVVVVVVVVVVVEVVVTGLAVTHTEGDTCTAVCILPEEPPSSA